MPEGVYIANFLWNEDRPFLPSNINTCKKGLVHKLKQTPELLTIYDHCPVKKDSVTTVVAEEMGNQPASMVT